MPARRFIKLLFTRWLFWTNFKTEDPSGPNHFFQNIYFFFFTRQPKEVSNVWRVCCSDLQNRFLYNWFIVANNMTRNSNGKSPRTLMHIEINYYNFRRIYSTQRQIINIAHWFPVNTGRLLDIHNAQKMYLWCFEVGLCTLGLRQNTWNTNDYH